MEKNVLVNKMKIKTRLTLKPTEIMLLKERASVLVCVSLVKILLRLACLQEMLPLTYPLHKIII